MLLDILHLGYRFVRRCLKWDVIRRGDTTFYFEQEVCFGTLILASVSVIWEGPLVASNASADVTRGVYTLVNAILSRLSLVPFSLCLRMGGGFSVYRFPPLPYRTVIRERNARPSQGRV